MLFIVMIAGLLGLGLILMEKFEGSIADCKVIDDVVFKLLYPLLFIVSVPMISSESYIEMSRLSLTMIVVLFLLNIVIRLFATVFSQSRLIGILVSQFFTLPRLLMFSGPVLLIAFGPEMILALIVVGILPSVVMNSTATKKSKFVCTFKPLFDASYQHPLPMVFGLLCGFVISVLPLAVNEFTILSYVYQFLCPAILVMSMARVAVEFQNQRITFLSLCYVLVKFLFAAVITFGLASMGFNNTTISVIGLILISPCYYLVYVSPKDLPDTIRFIEMLQQSHFWTLILFAFIIPIVLGFNYLV